MAGIGSIFPSAFSEWFDKLLVSQAFPTVVDLQCAVFPLANQRFRLGGTVVAMLGVQLQQMSMVPYHPIVADPPFGFQAEDLAQLGSARLASVVVLRLAGGSRKAPIVLR